jgi:hypothetical protein
MIDLHLSCESYTISDGYFIWLKGKEVVPVTPGVGALASSWRGTPPCSPTLASKYSARWSTLYSNIHKCFKIRREKITINPLLTKCYFFGHYNLQVSPHSCLNIKLKNLSHCYKCWKNSVTYFSLKDRDIILIKGFEHHKTRRKSQLKGTLTRKSVSNEQGDALCLHYKNFLIVSWKTRF